MEITFLKPCQELISEDCNFIIVVRNVGFIKAQQNRLLLIYFDSLKSRGFSIFAHDSYLQILNQF